MTWRARLEAHAAKVRERTPRPVAFQWPRGAPERESDSDGDAAGTAELVYCPTPLAFRLALGSAEGHPRPTILLTPCGEKELGLDVVARLARRRLHRLDSFATLRAELDVTSIDPRLAAETWLADHLLALPPEERPHTPAGVLGVEEVWTRLLTRLGFSGPRPDATELLAWSAGDEGPARFAALEPDVRAGYQRQLERGAGPLARRVVAAVGAADRGAFGPAAGFVLDAVSRLALRRPDEAARALGRFEVSFLAGDRLEAADLAAWSRAAAELAEARLAAGERAAVVAWLAAAQSLAEELRFADPEAESDWLPVALEARGERFGAVLAEHLARRAALSDLETAGALWFRHRLATGDTRETVENVLRLARFLASPAGEEPSFEAAVAEYAESGSQVDRLRRRLGDRELPSWLATSGPALLGAVATRREVENRRFALGLAAWLPVGGESRGALPLEGVLASLIAPLVTARPTLLLVLDGASVPVYRELAEDLRASGWQEVRPVGVPEPRLGVALVPSVTQVSRTSLLCGAPTRGGAAVEKEGFARQPNLRAATIGSLPPVLYHQGDLGAGPDLPAPVQAELLAPRRRLVGVVLNAVDDQLPRGRQLIPEWRVKTLRFLSQLLDLASAAGRVVVITADHGHVFDRSETRRVARDGSGARYRPVQGAPEAGEIVLAGPRVLGEDPAGWIVAWSEELRYSHLQAGYHGGASPQEMLVPLAVWLPAGDELADWEPAAEALPRWWDGAEVSTGGPPAPRPRGRKVDQPGLFESVGEDLVARLLASETYREQSRLTARLGLADAEVARALRALEERGGASSLVALGRALELGPARLPTFLAALQRRLNVEGFAVLAVDVAADKVELHRDLLRVQFELGTAG